MPFIELKEIARTLVNILNQEQILFMVNVQSRLGTELAVENGRDRVEFSVNPSINPQTYIVSYVRPGQGIPIQFRLNNSGDYSLIILKMEKNLLDYDEFARDDLKNIIQRRVLRPADVDIARNEIERISRLD